MTMNMLSPMQKQMSVARTKLLFFMTASAIALVTATPAGALTITQLSNKDVGNPPFPATACVDVQNFATANGTPVGPFPCNNQFNEQWIYENGRFIGVGTHGNNDFNGFDRNVPVGSWKFDSQRRGS